MKHLTIVVFMLAVLLQSNGVFSQCEIWIGSDKQVEAENAHSNYRSALKMEDYELAFAEWQKAYNLAPAADGLRDFHYTDGIKIYKHQLESTNDDATKAQLKEKILKLYDQAAECYANQAIKVPGCSDQTCYDQRVGFVLGRKASDMYYIMNSPYSENLETCKNALEKSGNAAEYIVFEPIANMVVYQFGKDLISAEDARYFYQKVEEVTNYNVENNKDYGEYYEAAFARFKSKYAEIESEIFDCEYFKNKLKPNYDENPDDPEVVKYIYNKLKTEGCGDDDPLLMEMKSKYEEYAAAENARIQAEFEENNPGVLANRFYREGDFEGAIDKYLEALEQEEDAEKRSQYYFNIASIEFRKLGKLQSARENALKASSLRSDWGQPYLLIGDIYAKAANSCGSDAFSQRVVILAALEKYYKARSVDEEAASEANRKISIYNGNKPEKSDAFMRGYKEGQTISTGCWIGEQVKLTFN